MVYMAQDKILEAKNIEELVGVYKEAVGTNGVTNCHEFMEVKKNEAKIEFFS